MTWNFELNFSIINISVDIWRRERALLAGLHSKGEKEIIFEVEIYINKN